MARSRWDQIRSERGWTATRTKALSRKHSHYVRLDHAENTDDGTTQSTTYTATLTGSTGDNPSVTVDVGPTGKVLVWWTCQFRNSAVSSACFVGVNVSGANTAAASDNISILSEQAADDDTRFGGHHTYTGLNPGPTTFEMQYRISNAANTGTFLRREITAIAIDLASSLG